MPGPNSAPNGDRKLVVYPRIRLDLADKGLLRTGKTAIVAGKAGGWRDPRTNQPKRDGVPVQRERLGNVA